MSEKMGNNLEVEKKVSYEKSAETVFNLIENLTHWEDLQEDTVKFLELMKKHDEGTFYHECRVALISKKLAEFCGYTDTKPEFFGGANHDVGKLQVASNLLNGEDITKSEYERIKTHAENGAVALKKYLVTSFIAGSHHSHQKHGYGLDMSDLPKGIGEFTEKRIEDAAMNVALADFFDAAMTRKTHSFGTEESTDLKTQMLSVYPDYEDRIDFLLKDDEIREIV